MSAGGVLQAPLLIGGINPPEVLTSRFAGPLFISRPEIVQRANGPSVGHKPGHSGFV